MNNESFGRYQIIRELGHGGMSTVYMAHDPLSNRDVALKLLPTELLHDTSFRARFERESKAVAALDHPAIVPVYDSGEADGQPFLVMRLMTGGSLADRIRKGPMDLASTAKIITTIAPALDLAHTKGMVHRDLKPDNILFDQDEQPYLADFGIVKLSESGATLTGNAVVGTPAYMSPEQGRGEADIDGRSDIYSLGAILFEMLTARLPYDAETPMAQLLKHIGSPIPNILDFRSDLPADVQSIISCAMSKRKNTRYATAGDFAKALNAVATGKKLPKNTSAPTVSLPQLEQSALAPSSQAGNGQHRRPNILSLSENKKQKPKRSRGIVFVILSLLLILAGAAGIIVLRDRPILGASNSSPTALVQAEPISTAVETPVPSPLPVSTSTATGDFGITSTPTYPAVETDVLEPIITQPLLLPVRYGTPNPQWLEAISVDNLHQLTKVVEAGSGAYLSLAISPNGDVVAIGTTTGIYIANATDLQYILYIPTQYPVVKMAFSPDGILLATAEQNIVVVWKWQESQALYTFNGEKDYIDHVMFSGNGEILVGGGKNTFVWQVSDGVLLQKIEDFAASTVAISPDGQLLVIPVLERDARILNARDGTIMQEFRAYGAMHLTFSPNGSVLAATCGEIIRFWETEQWSPVGSISGISMDFSGDGQTVAVVGGSGSVSVWRFNDQHNPNVALKSYEYDTDGSVDIRLSAEGTYLALWYTAQVTDDPVSNKFIISTYRVADGALIGSLHTSKTWVSDVGFLPNEDGVVALSAQETVNLWAAEDGSSIANIVRVLGSNSTMTLAPFRMSLSGGVSELVSKNGEMKAVVVGQNIDIFFAKDNTKVRTVYANLDTPTDIDFNPTGQVIASVSTGGTVRVWTVDDGRQVCTIGGTSEFPTLPGISNIFFSEDGNTIGVYQNDATLSYWQASDCSFIYSFYVPAGMLSEDLTIFVEGQEQFNFRSRDNGSLLLTIYGPFLPSGPQKAGFFEAGRVFSATLWDGTVYIWAIVPDET